MARISEYATRLGLKTLGGNTRVRTERGWTYCIFDNGSVSSGDPVGGMRLDDTAPQITVTSDEAERLGMNVRETAISIEEPYKEAVGYRIRDPRPDGTGISIIFLDALA